MFNTYVISICMTNIRRGKRLIKAHIIRQCTLGGLLYCMDIDFWYSGEYHMKQREHVVFFRNACKMQIVYLISILTVQ